MSIVTPGSVGTPDQIITHTALNGGFTPFSVTYNRDNLRPDCLHNYHLQTIAITSLANSVSNTVSTTTSYAGTTYQAITHNTALNTGAFSLANGATLRVHWHQYVHDMTIAVNSMDRWTSFKLQWDIGAGYVDIPDLLLWGVWACNEISTGVFLEDHTHNMTGSWVYTNNTGSTIVVAGIRLMVRPSDSVVGDSVDLGEGNIGYVVQRL